MEVAEVTAPGRPNRGHGHDHGAGSSQKVLVTVVVVVVGRNPGVLGLASSRNLHLSCKERFVKPHTGLDLQEGVSALVR